MILTLFLLSSLVCHSWAAFDPPYHRPHYHPHGGRFPPPRPRPFPSGGGPGPYSPPRYPPPSSSDGGFGQTNEELLFEAGDKEHSYPDIDTPNRRGRLEVLFSWKIPDFTWPSKRARQDAIRSQRYIPNNTFILDVDVYEGRSGRKVFVTLPRARPGVPVTIATVTNQKSNGGNLLAPFPNWESHTSDVCADSITSVFRTHVDPCGRLWVLDSGNNNVFAGASRIVCPPQVLIFDLNNNNKLIGRYEIPKSMVEDSSLFVTIAVDTRRRDCSDAFAYIADSIAYKMIVFDSSTEQFWRINSILFNPYPDQSRFDVSGVSFDLSGGIFGLALGPLYRGNRRLYFHCIDSVKQSWVDTGVIRNQSLFQSNMNAARRSFNLFQGSRSSQSAAATMNTEGVMFFGLLGSNEVACWNSATRFDRNNLHVIAKDDRNLQFTSGIKVYGNKLYVLTSRLQNYITGQVPTTQENYRVLVGDVPSLTRGTSCQVDPLNTRFNEEYQPNSESVEYSNSDFAFSQD